MAENWEMILPIRNQRKSLSRFRMVLVPFQKGCLFSGIFTSVSSGSRVKERKTNEITRMAPVIRNRTLKSYLSETLMRMIPARIEPMLDNPLAAADCEPKNVPLYSPGMILLIMEVHGLAVKPPPKPCHANKRKEMISAFFFPRAGRNHATNASPMNGILS